MIDWNENNPTTLTRRTFCVQACEAASLAAVASLMQACGGSPTGPSGSSAPPLPTVGASVAGSGVTVNVAGSVLANVGGAALVQASNGSFLVARTAQDSFIALTAVCTHEGCAVSGFQNQNYVCPCHGSTFTTSGSVVAGPATRALRQFPTQFVNNVLTITT